jgi:hypothetical protein
MYQWLKPVTLATKEAEIKEDQGSKPSGQTVYHILSRKCQYEENGWRSGSSRRTAVQQA